MVCADGELFKMSLSRWSTFNDLLSDEPIRAGVGASDGARIGPSRFSIFTLNVGNGLGSPARHADGSRRSTADVVGLAEATARQAAGIRTSLVDTFPYQVHAGDGIPGKALISRYPILELAATVLAVLISGACVASAWVGARNCC